MFGGQKGGVKLSKMGERKDVKTEDKKRLKMKTKYKKGDEL